MSKVKDTSLIATCTNSQNAIAIEAINTADADAIVATTSSPNHAALAGHNNNGGYGVWVASDNASGNVGGIGVYARGHKYAAQFDGQVQVSSLLLVACIPLPLLPVKHYGKTSQDS